MAIFIKNGVYFKATDVKSAKVAATKTTNSETIVLKDFRGNVISTKVKGKWKDKDTAVVG